MVETCERNKFHGSTPDIELSKHYIKVLLSEHL